MAGFARMVVIAVTLISCVGCDQATKAMAKAQLPRNEVLSFAGDALRSQYAENNLSTVGAGLIVCAILGYLLLRPPLDRAAM